MNQIKAHLYVRHSTEAKRQKDSKRRQEEICLKAIKEHENLVYENTLYDAAKSAYKSEQFESGLLGKFIDDLEAGAIETPCCLVLEAVDRWSRADIRYSQRHLDRVLMNGCDLYFVKENIYLSEDDELDISSGIMLMLAQKLANDHSAGISSRIRKRLDQRKRELASGDTVKQNTPWFIQSTARGYRKAYDKEVAYIVAERLKGKGSTTIANEMNALVKKGSLKLPEGFKAFTRHNVMQCIRNVALYGTMSTFTSWTVAERRNRERQGLPTGRGSYPTELVAGVYPAHIDKDTFDRMNKAVKTVKGRHAGSDKFVNVLRGLLHCSCCKDAGRGDRSVSIKRGASRYISLFCQARQVSSINCDNPSVRLNELTCTILKALEGNPLVAISDAEDVAPLEGQKLILEEKVANTMEHIANVPPRLAETFYKQLEQLDNELNEVNERISKARGAIAEDDYRDMTAQAFLKLTDQEGRMELNNTLQRVIDKVYVNGHEKTYEVLMHNGQTLTGQLLSGDFTELDILMNKN
ncbi:recombinase family protein [Vibrio harveyi]|uniref:recombinase family protein n=1 Tax=Vibrio harveyi TaxID=669 RepID=UPI0018F193A0|nr:recombinase family protein [Vibrio harveyi]